MLTVTDSASAHLAKLLVEAKAPGGAAARFVASPDGLALQLDAKRDGDQVFSHGDQPVLLLDAQVADLLSDKRLDIQETAEGIALTLEEGETEEA